MSETWFPWCIRQDGPSDKRGYGGVPTRQLSEIEGEVKHSTEGSFAAALGELFKPTREASWHFTLPKDGPPRQHYPLEAITWHCGQAGDRRTDTSLVGNITLVGIEHEDYPDNQLSGNQIKNTVRLTQDIRAHCPHVAANPPALRVNLWEHGWLSATACPSGLIPWAEIIAELKEDDMPLTAEDMRQIETLIVRILRSEEFSVGGINYRVGRGVSLNDVMTVVQGIKGGSEGTTQQITAEVAERFADELAERLKD